jgi:hypothetical protein
MIESCLRQTNARVVVIRTAGENGEMVISVILVAKSWNSFKIINAIKFGIWNKEFIE